MLAPLKNTVFRHLFCAQVTALIGTGIATVALALLAYDLAEANAGFVLGIALAIKMMAYVIIAPIAGAYADRLPRRGFLVALDLVRMVMALLLPFLDAIWQIYILIFVLQSASAAFTPTFQATIADILPDEREYTSALSLSRLAYDLESLLSPVFAAILLTVISFHWLFAGTAMGFLLSALLVLSVILPRTTAEGTAFKVGVWEKTTKGIRAYLATPRLQGLFALSFVASAAGAMVIVNTVVFVRVALSGSETDVAVALAIFGAASMAVALFLPKLLERIADRTILLVGGFIIAAILFGASGLSFTGVLFDGSSVSWILFLTVWFILGAAYSAILTPSGRLVRRSAHAEGRPALYAAQFALSHGCWLITYPLAGWLIGYTDYGTAFAVFGLLAVLAMIAAIMVWPVENDESLTH